MKKIPSLFLLLLIICLLSGCWDRTELNDVSIVTGIAIDKGKNHKFKMTVEAINPSENAKLQAQGFAPSITYSQEGDSLSELANRMNVGMSRKLIYSHTRVVVITKDIAKWGLIGFLDYLERSGEFRNDFNIVLYEGEEAAEALKITYPLQKISSLKLDRQIETLHQNWGGDPNIRLTDFISSITSKGKDPVLATIKIKGSPEKGKSVENMQKVEPDALIEVSGLGVFDDDKLISTLPITDTRNYLWVKGLPATNMSIPCDDQDGFFDVKIRRAHSTIKASYEQNKPKFKVLIKAEGKIEGTQCAVNLEKIKTYQDLEEKTMEKVKNDVIGTIKTMQEMELDIFGFGEEFERQHYKEFQKLMAEWGKHFANADIEVETNIHLRRSGVRNKSYHSEN
ncbi:Ger(x)C family spore germination protein [Bacillus sp. AK128]